MHTKWTARRLAADAMFAAMVTVLAAAAIKTGNLKITIEAMPVFLGALMLGPVDGMVIGGIGTLLYQLLSYGVTATTALWIAPYVLLGLCVGAVSARHGYACTKRQLVLLAVLAVTYRPLLFSSLDEQVAQAKGVPIGLMNVLFMAVLAGVITIAVPAVGTLLIFALVVTPAATATMVRASRMPGMRRSTARRLISLEMYPMRMKSPSRKRLRVVSSWA